MSPSLYILSLSSLSPETAVDGIVSWQASNKATISGSGCRKRCKARGMPLYVEGSALIGIRSGRESCRYLSN